MVRSVGGRVAAVAMVAAATCGLMATMSPGAMPAGAATGATTSSACTFNGSALPIVTGASAGEPIQVACSGLPPLHPYLVFETSLLLGIDPKAAPLLSGKIVSVQGLYALLAALPEINPLALSVQTSNLFGELDFTYVLPDTQAPDPNTVCPPTTAQINAGLIGCALATIDLTSFKPVGAATAVVEYAGDPVFPPAPTLALGASVAKVGDAITVRDDARRHHILVVVHAHHPRVTPRRWFGTHTDRQGDADRQVVDGDRTERHHRLPGRLQRPHAHTAEDLR